MQAIVFSRNRAAQLDLLLHSISERAPDLFQQIHVLYRGTNVDYLHGYKRCFDAHPHVQYGYEHSFQAQVGRIISDSPSKYVSFLCDDDIFVRNHTDAPKPYEALEETPGMLCFSLRLGLNTNDCYPLRRQQRQPVILERFRDMLVWAWANSDGDWGYPGSLDGHVFRKQDLENLLTGRDYAGPNRLEDILTNRCFGLDDQKPLMACYEQSLVTGVPINRVNDDYPNRSGETHPQPSWDLNVRYLSGGRLAFPDNPQITGAHTELELVFA
jgi:hypothetical protein